MRDVEYLATLASLLKPEKYSYPKDTIDTCWEKVLLNQFHDGRLCERSSSIPRLINVLRL